MRALQGAGGGGGGGHGGIICDIVAIHQIKILTSGWKIHSR